MLKFQGRLDYWGHVNKTNVYVTHAGGRKKKSLPSPEKMGLKFRKGEVQGFGFAVLELMLLYFT